MAGKQRVALIGDVHANLPALETVLAHARQHGAEAIWDVGDVVGYGPFPEASIRRLQEENVISIVGNYDLKVLAFEAKRKKWRRKKRPEKFLAFQWAYANLSEGSRRYLRSLPQKRTIEIAGRRILLTHGSPASIEEHLTPVTSQERLEALSKMIDADVLVCGHSHRPFVRRAGETLFVNTGSVGRPDDGDPRAAYAILDVGTAVRVRHYRLTYDVEAAVGAIRERRLPEALAQVLIQGRDLGRVLAAPETWSTPDPDAAIGASIASIASIAQTVEGKRRLEAVLATAETYHYEAAHARQVTRLALRLFDETRPMHRLDAEARFLLRCGALLHDIGWIEGQKGHHKTSLRLILETDRLPFDARERRVIASIARYHRGALPKDKHEHFAALSPVDQWRVSILAGLLRVADGLDCTHRSVVVDLACKITPENTIVRCTTRGNAEPEREQALDKGDLWERVFRRRLLIEQRPA